MDLNEAKKTAKALMLEHGVGGLHFAFDNGKRRIGATHFQSVKLPTGVRKSMPVKITLSRHYVELLRDDEIHDVILHEIAHALAGKDAGHGPEWMRMARRIGADPRPNKRTSARPEPSCKGMCLSCNEVRKTQHRLPLSIYVCPVCKRAGKPVADTVLVWYKNNVFVESYYMPVRYRQTLDRVLNRPVASGINFGIFD